MTTSEITTAFRNSIDDGCPDRRLAKRVLDCPDILPSSACNTLGIPLGSTYGQAARFVRDAAR